MSGDKVYYEVIADTDCHGDDPAASGLPVLQESFAERSDAERFLLDHGGGGVIEARCNSGCHARVIATIARVAELTQ